MKKIDVIKECISKLENNKLIGLWNEICEDIDIQIFDNDEEFWDNFINTNDAVRAVCYGNYNYTDKYVMFDDYGNLLSMDEDDAVEKIDKDKLADSLLDREDNVIIDIFAGYDFNLNGELLDEEANTIVLTDEDKKKISEDGYTDEDIKDICDYIHTVTFRDEDDNLIPLREVLENMDRDVFISGIERCMFHRSAVRDTNDNREIFFESIGE